MFVTRKQIATHRNISGKQAQKAINKLLRQKKIVVVKQQSKTKEGATTTVFGYQISEDIF